MGTFHATCLGILRENIENVQVRPTPRIEIDRDKLLPDVRHLHSVEEGDNGVGDRLVRPYARGFGVYDETESLKVIRDIMKKTLGWSV